MTTLSTETVEDRELLAAAARSVRDAQRLVKGERRQRTEPVAIVGMACRFPGGAESLEDFWSLLMEGREGLSPVPEQRWRNRDFYAPPPGQYGRIYVQQSHFLRSPLDEFDAAHFRISPAEANAMDPQQRILLEETWRALEDAGIPPSSLSGTSTGVFLGVPSMSEYGLLPRDPHRVNQYNGTGTSASIASGRLAYVLGLHGAALSVDTACSSSLVALLLAVAALRSREVDVAIVGGTSLMLSPEAMSTLCAMNAVSEDGRSLPFADGGAGYGRGEGVGVVVLERAHDAQAQGRRVWAYVKGGAKNNDGASAGLTVPNRVAQRDVLRAGLRAAGVEASSIDVVEAHGTGTPLGDPIEMMAINEVYGQDSAARSEPLRLGAVKGNIGHLECAAGIAAVIKSALSLHHGVVPPMVTGETVNPRVDLDVVPAVLPREVEPWPVTDHPRRVGVSAFGFSGTNAHVVLEAAPTGPEVQASAVRAVDEPVAVCVSGGTAASLLAGASELERYLERYPEVSLREVAAETALRRDMLAVRAVVRGRTRDELLAALRAFRTEASSPEVVFAADETLGGNYRAGFARSSLRRFAAGAVLVAKVADRVPQRVAVVFGEHVERAAFEELAARFPQLADHYEQFLTETDHRVSADERVRALARSVAFANLLEALGVEASVWAGDAGGAAAAAVASGAARFVDAATHLARNEAVPEASGTTTLLRPGERPQTSGYHLIVQVGRANGADEEYSGVETMRLLDGTNAVESLHAALSALSTLGVPVRWSQWFPAGLARPEVLPPGLVFTRSRYWLTPPEGDTHGAVRGRGLEGQPVDVPGAPVTTSFVLDHGSLPELGDNDGVLHVGYILELVLRSLRLTDTTEFALSNVELLLPLIVPPATSREVLVQLGDVDAEGERPVRVYSRARSEDPWVEHVAARSVPVVEALAAPEWPDEQQAVFGPDDFYPSIEERGFHFGETVRQVKRIAVANRGARVFFLDDEATAGYELAFHPSVLDSCAQTFNYLALGDTPVGSQYMVRRIGHVQMARTPRGSVWGTFQYRPQPVESRMIGGHVTLSDSSGPFLALRDVELKQFDGATLIRLVEATRETSTGGDDKELLASYLAAAREDKLDVVVAGVLGLLAAELEMDETPEPDATLDELGFDSLVGLRLFRRLKDAYSIELSMSDVVGASSPRTLAYVVMRFLPEGADLVPAEEEPAPVKPDSVELWLRGGGSDEAEHRLICFPHGFGSADMFDVWRDDLAGRVDVWGVKLPGLDIERIQEAAPHSVDAVIDELADVLDRGGLLDRPVSAFGHSWGSLFAYRFAVRLEATGRPPLRALFVSGYTSASLPNTSAMEIVDALREIGFDGIPTVAEVIRAHSVDQVTAAFVRAWGHEDSFAEAALAGVSLTLPTILEAYRLVASQPTDRAEPVSVPMYGFHGIDDNRVTLADMAKWADLAHGGFSLITLPGDHGFIDESQMGANVRKEIATVLGVA
mgnify:FL=1